MVIAMIYKMIVPRKGIEKPYLTCRLPLREGLKAQPKLQAMVVKLATIARAEGSTRSITNVLYTGLLMFIKARRT